MNRRTRFRRRGSRQSIAMFLAAVGYLLLLLAVAGSVGEAFRLTSGSILFALLALLPTLALISQFVLPVRERNGRRSVVGRLFNYLLGERGTVTFVRDGEPQAARDERALRGAGVIWVDHLSAALLRTDTAMTRIVGPGGLAFTEPGEWLAEGFDLRRQKRSVPGSIPPAGLPATADEVSAMALTLDGIPVSASLSITFVLERRTPVESSDVADAPPIVPSIGSLQAAAYGKMVSDEQDWSWSEIPLRLVVELWRDEVKDRNLDEFLADYSSVIAGIEAAILARLTQESSESDLRLIQERGIRILDISISDLQIPGAIQAEQLQAWFDGWAGPVRKQLDEAVDMVREAGIRGEASASMMLIERLTHKMSQQLQLDHSLSQRDATILILEDAAQLCADVPRLSSLSTQVREVLEQAKARDSECLESEGKR
ncbi:MAG: hypothetical protein ACE5JF_09605 [Anaerolineales bacterium]